VTLQHKSMKKILLSPWTALLTLALVIGIRAADPAFVESVRLRYFDTLIVNQAATVNEIWTVDIDEAAITQHGQWPFPRTVYAELIEELYRRDAGLVVFNVLMPETDRAGGDTALAAVMRQHIVILPNIPADQNKNTPRRPGSAVIGSQYLDRIVSYPGLIANIPELERSAQGVGTVHTLPELDGVNRRMPLVIAVGDNLYPSLAFEIMRVAASDSTFQVKLNELGVERIRIPKFGPVASDSLGRIWIDWSQTAHSATMTALPESFDGALVIVGPTAAGISNPVATSLGAVHPHAVQAAVVGTLLNGVAIQRPDWTDGAEIVALVVLSIVLLILTRWVYVGIISAVVVLAGSVGSSLYLFSAYSWLVDSTAIAVGLGLVLLHAYGVKFVNEFLQKQAIKKQFAGYASPTVVRLLQENPSLIKDGVKKEVSICFSDLRGFTPLGESFGDDVKGLTEVMNGYMDAITKPVLEANGMIIKYIGDASMHIHNAPIEDPDHAKTAVVVGLKMVRAVEQFSRELEAKGRPGVKMGAGINTGLGYIGEMGSTARHSYDVLGDAVSTTARIESKCKEYGCVLLVGENTVKQCGDAFLFLKIDDLAVKGKSVGVGIYTVLDTDAGAMPEYLMAQATHEEMHRLYRAQEFDQAIEICKELKQEFDGQMTDYYAMWIERCEFQKTQRLPADWNGVFIAQSK
jgi:adenylate cyclase